MPESESGSEAFARRLRGMREASGRSYGALARRVGVSASTLHRYCSGHTVPLEFAPIERLAALCGCRGEQLVLLHRLWVLADAERDRRQESGAAKVAAAAEAVRERSAAGVPEASPERSADAIRPEAAGSTVPPRSPRWRRAVHAAGLVAVTVLPLLVLPTFERTTFSPEGRPGQGRVAGPWSAGAGAPAPPASGTAADPSAPPFVSAPLPSPSTPSPSASPPRSAVPSSSDSPRAASSGPSAGPLASAGPSRSGSRTARPEPGGASKRRGGALPFTWGVDQHLWAGGCSHSYLIDRGPSAVPPPPSVSDAEPWARSLGAVHGGDTLVRVTVQGRGEEAVVLQSLRVRVAAQRPPQRRNVYGMSMGCGGTMTPRMFDVDLDAARPAVRSVPGNDSGAQIPAVSFPYRVSVRDPEVLLVTGRTVKCDCEWYLELEWSSGERSGTVRIDDGGRPFRTSGVEGGPAYLYDTTTRRWVPAPGPGGGPHPDGPPPSNGPPGPGHSQTTDQT
ncbi:helix-turn-helix domain-containing protein [Streptomyces uncialis]|uniref:helix-turn-helix domain-containing protein n=1 Tax=Streptomyces uncialis TaxID=1048205 RepID=UPI0033E414CE